MPNESGQAGGGSVGIGFAVPSNLATHVAGQIISGQPIGYAYLGLQAAPLVASNGQSLRQEERENGGYSSRRRRAYATTRRFQRSTLTEYS